MNKSRSGQVQNPSSPPNNVPPKEFGNWFRTRSPKTKLGLGLIFIALLLCMFMDDRREQAPTRQSNLQYPYDHGYQMLQVPQEPLHLHLDLK